MTDIPVLFQIMLTILALQIWSVVPGVILVLTGQRVLSVHLHLPFQHAYGACLVSALILALLYIPVWFFAPTIPSLLSGLPLVTQHFLIGSLVCGRMIRTSDGPKIGLANGAILAGVVTLLSPAALGLMNIVAIIM